MSAADLLLLWSSATAEGRLAFPRCASCGAWNWYPLPSCRACGAEEMRMEDVAPRGVVHSWTRIHRAFGKEPAAPLPYVDVIVEIDAARGVRLVCLQDGSDDPVIGSPVALRASCDDKRSGRWLCQSATRPR
jgi:uncharacterized OB-fold protein